MSKQQPHSSRFIFSYVLRLQKGKNHSMHRFLVKEVTRRRSFCIWSSFEPRKLYQATQMPQIFVVFVCGALLPVPIA
ncbi:hypothetical protein NC653_025456 [Populus alba x Populus x berolinensis]|uniref:Uncharacterized protein n=1 Tax=Populus alba x Populus x berolinensis TaxID=444605 RepID=A0AAD6MDM1_9ROSI|nr:hypothetical protein NC653_025456 [Populus alba x Populus x berolinensis]